MIFLDIMNLILYYYLNLSVHDKKELLQSLITEKLLDLNIYPGEFNHE